MQVLKCCALGLKKAYSVHAPKIGVLGFHPNMGSSIIATREGTSFLGNASYHYRSLKSVHRCGWARWTATPRAFQWAGQLPKLTIPLGRSGPPSNIWLLGPSRVSPSPNGISIVYTVFSGFTNLTSTQTDKPRYSICSNRPLSLAVATMRSNNNKISRLLKSTNLLQELRR